jgi:putative transcriptional regulator
LNTPREKLIKCRKDKGWTQGELAKRTGISRAYLSNIEAGKHTPSLEVARNLSALLGISMEELF